MKHLTFLDYTILEAKGKSIDAQLQMKDKQLQSLSDKVSLLEKGLHMFYNMVDEDFDKHLDSAESNEERASVIWQTMLKAKNRASD
jgi:hypothetical protein